MTGKRIALPRGRRRQAGQSFMEYLVVTLVAVVALASGNPSPLSMLSEAIQKHYTDYSFAMSIATIPKCSSSSSAGGFTVTVDTCPDLANPTWPVSISTP